MSLAFLRPAKLFPARSWRRRLLILFSPLLVLLLAGVVLLLWALHTAGGARWAWRQLVQNVPALSASGVQGSLAGGLQLDQLRYADAGTTLQIQRAELRLDIDWLPWPQAEIKPLQLHQVRLQLPAPSTDKAEPAPLPEDLSAPLLIQLRELAIDDFQLSDAAGETILTVRSLQLALDYQQKLTLQHLQLSGLQLSTLELNLDGQGEVALQAPFKHTIQLHPHLQLSLPEQPTLGLELELTSVGDLEQLQATLSSREQSWLRGFQLDAQLSQLLTTPQLDSQLQLEHLQWPPSTPAQLQLNAIRGQIHGPLQALRLDLGWHQQQPTLAAGDWQLQLIQQDQLWQMQELSGLLTGGQLSATGQFDPAQQHGELNLKLSDVDPTRLFPEQAETLASLGQWQGEISASGDPTQIHLHQLSFSQTGGAGAVQGEASWLQENGQLSADLNWQGLRWDNGGEILGSETGSLRLSGTQHDYQLAGQAQLSASSYPPGRFQLRGQGNESQFQLAQLHLDWLGGQVEADGNVRWQPQLAWQLNLSTQAINPRALVPAMDGELNLQAETQGQQQGNDWDAQIELKQLSGTLQGRPLGGQGSLRYRQGQFSSEGLKLNSGTTELLLHSAPPPVASDHDDAAKAAQSIQAAHSDGQALHWQLRLAQLGDWLAPARGALNIEGWVLPGNDALVGAAHLHSPGLRWADWQLEQLRVESQLQLPWPLEWGALDRNSSWFSRLDASLARLSGPALDQLAPWQGLSRLSIHLENLPHSQHLQVSAHGLTDTADANPEQSAVQLILNAGDWPAAEQTIQAELAQFDLAHPLIGSWTLAESVPLEITPPQVSGTDWQYRLGSAIDTTDLIANAAERRQQLIAQAQAGLCLQSATAAADGARLCLHSQWQDDLHELHLGLQGFALNRLQHWLPDWQIHQSQAELALTLAHHGTQVDGLGLELAVSPGWISPNSNGHNGLTGNNKNGKNNQFSLDQALLSVALNPAGQLELHSLWTLEGDARLESKLQLSDWQSLLQGDEWPEQQWASHPQARVNGELDLAWQRLASLHKLVPQLGPISGEFRGSWQFQGPWLNPGVQGHLDLNQLSWSDARTGLRLRQGEMHLRSGTDQAIQLEGGFLLGEGRAEMSGQLDLAQRQWQLQLKGTDLELLNGPQGKLYANPDLQLSGTADALNLAGNIMIPQAKLRPVAGNNPVLVSNDVILAGEPAPVPTPGPAIHGQLRIALGDAVHINADNARARLSGALDLHWQGEALPEAEGQIRLEQGGIRAYGQNLELKRGLIVFENGPVDDPRLEIRAARRIFGDPSVDWAGVQVEGTAQNPRVRLFTEPSTNEERALSYLVTGSNFDHGNGQGALSVGIYILPRLFVSYGFGLFENGNVLSTRYELSDHWSVQTISGARDTGVDLSWSVDR